MTPTFLERLKAEPETPQAQFNLFIMNYRPTGRVVYCFLEGRDDLPFYSIHIRHRLVAGFGLSFVKCGNKDSVLANLQDFLSRFEPNPRALFFVDKDLDDLIGRASPSYDYLFVTQGYSIENELCLDSLVERYCVESLGLNSQSPFVQQIVVQFHSSWASFVSQALVLMSWVLAVRIKGHRPNLRNIDTKEVFTFLDEDLSVGLKGSPDEVISYLRSVTGKTSALPAIDKQSLEAATERLAGLNPAAWLRGKQALWFMVRFLVACERALVSSGVKARARVALTTSNAIELLCPKIDSPAGLDAFMLKVSSSLGSD